MGYINFDLSNAEGLRTLASEGPGIPGTLPADMPDEGGLYMIYNPGTDNRYIGKSGNISRRFEGRMQTVNELGLSQMNLESTCAFWGDVDVWNTPEPVNGIPAPFINTLIQPIGQPVFGFQVIRNDVGLAPPMPNSVLGTRGGNINYGAQQVTTTIDGATINLEALFIRFITQAYGAGGTITNRNYLGPFTNPTNHELIVQFEWAACINPHVAAGHYCISIPANGQF